MGARSSASAWSLRPGRTRQFDAVRRTGLRRVNPESVAEHAMRVIQLAALLAAEAALTISPLAWRER